MKKINIWTKKYNFQTKKTAKEFEGKKIENVCLNSKKRPLF